MNKITGFTKIKGFTRITGFTRVTVSKYSLFYYNHNKNNMFTGFTRITGLTRLSVYDYYNYDEIIVVCSYISSLLQLLQKTSFTRITGFTRITVKIYSVFYYNY